VIIELHVSIFVSHRVKPTHNLSNRYPGLLQHQVLTVDTNLWSRVILQLKFNTEEAMTAQRGSGGTSLLFLQPH
jgi:hypothetical protein